MRDPSGDQAACIAAAEPRVIWRSTPLCTSRTQIFMKPSRSDEYASDLPSGDHAGSVSRYGSSVSRRGIPAIGMVHRSPTAANAT